MTDELEQLLAAERAIPAAPAAVRERVAARLAQSRRRAAWRRRALIAGVGMAAVAALAIALWPRAHDGASGAATQGEVAIGGRARAEVGAGADVRWQLAADGAARVVQARGNVLYTVEHGAPFVVETPAARITVRGTIFRVEVTPMTPAVKRAGLGAIVIGAVLVSVYEGRVLVANNRGEADVVAGERALARAGQAPARIDDTVPNASAAAVAFDDDPRGTLRLEGLVLGEDDAPVAGATVVVDARPPREVRTEADGTFAFDGLVPRGYALDARHGELFAGPVTARLTATSDPVVLRLARGTSLDVTIVDEAQRPLAGAKVELARTGTRTAAAGSDGIARFPGVGPGFYEISAEAAGYARAMRGFQLAGLAGVVERRTIVLARGAAASGVVLGPDRQPVAGATVRAVATSQFDAATIEAEGQTDAAGRFRFAALAAGTYRFAASHRELAAGVTTPEPVDGKTERGGLTIVLGDGGTVSGRVVTKAGAAAPFATVRVGGALDPADRFAIRQATCDAAGTFTIAALPRSSIELIAAHDGGTTAPMRVDLAARPRVADLRLVLDLDGVIAGVVVDARGAPVADAQVAAEPEDEIAQTETPLLALPPTAISDAAGGFELRGLAAGSWRVRATRPGVQYSGLWQRHGTPVAVGKRDARIGVEDAGEVTGRVTLTGDRSVGPFTVALDYDATVPVADPQGRFRLRGVPPGRYRLRITGPGFAQHETAALVVEAGRPTELGTIVVDAGRTVRGRVVDGKGAPVAGAEVIASELLIATIDVHDQGGGRMTTTRGDGSFELRGMLASGLSIAARRGVEVSPTRTIAAGSADLAVELVLAPSGAIEGRVQRAGTAIAAVVTAEPDGGGAIYSVHSGADGTYHIDGLAPGRYKLTAAKPGAVEVIGGVRTPLATIDVRSAATARADLTIVAGITVEVDVLGAAGQPVKAFVTLVANATSPTAAEVRDGLHAPIVLDERPPEAAVVNEVAPGNYAACAQVVTDVAAIAAGTVDISSLPFACTPIAVRATPGTQHFRVPATH